MGGILLKIENGASGPRGGSGLPNGGRALLRNLGLLKSWARLKAFKVRLRRGFIGFRNTQVLTQIQRVTACNVSNGEPIRDQIFMIGDPGIEHSQARQIPLLIIFTHQCLGLIGLELGVSQVERLRKCKGCIAVIQPVEVGAVLGLLRPDAEIILLVLLDEVVTDP